MNRNEPCHCGSGEKYKRCCQQSDRNALPKSTRLIILALLPIALGGVVWSWIHRGDDTSSESGSRFSTSAPAAGDAAAPGATTSNPIGVPGPQPEGPVPPGKVWSTEHGHWHDASPVQVQASSADGLAATIADEQPATTPVDGEERNGQVYSAEHGHWHDAAAATGSQPATTTAVPRSQIPRVTVRPDGEVASTGLTPQPEGPAPEGKVWSAEHGHWHDKPVFPSGEPDPDSGGN